MGSQQGVGGDGGRVRVSESQVLEEPLNSPLAVPDGKKEKLTTKELKSIGYGLGMGETGA